MSRYTAEPVAQRQPAAAAACGKHGTPASGTGTTSSAATGGSCAADEASPQLRVTRRS
jgi:hypothetical protein